MQAILFDLDGTLLPMDQNVFMKGYFQELAVALSPLGLEPDALVHAVWAGTKAMIKNDGGRSNDAVFWTVFAQTSGMDSAMFQAASDLFYTREFHRVKRCTGENPQAEEAVQRARDTGCKVVLATNPLFPMCGQASRLSWIGLKPENFDLVTSYESDRFCKPNPAYYLEICSRIGTAPEECLMIGNDEWEDMYAAASVGMQGYLVTDCCIPCTEHPWQGRRGTFAEMLAFLQTLAN